MTRFMISSAALVAAIATLKTFLVFQFALGAQADMATVIGLFGLFLTMTAGVAYVAYSQLRAYIGEQRKKRLTPGASEPVAKETVILRNAPEWGLSQAEADVAIFVAKGFSNSEIADMRGCAITTVKSQLGQIYKKSGLASRYQLIAFVTDEVCAMSKEPEADPTPISTRKILPLVSRTKKSDADMVPQHTQMQA